ncbi:DNA-binding transcriptional regulator, MarR family [Formivibrio citricus]|uniref:DNA-binding transcriptional regulator, MarR family n=2 Tax=Formivibrio citricus TaxID=83765 RepID=A0A1I4Y4G2_9NEIS|nr:DNA-binding transcriptional regulator, MarR family [Formivibrio citricus]
MSKKNEARLNSALELLFYGYRAFTALPDEILAERKLARVHHRILYFVARDPGLSVNKLLSRLCVSKQALNAPLRELQERGLVISVASEQDRRVKCLNLTEEGMALEAQLSASQHKLLSSIFNICGPEAETGWRMVMTALANNSPDKLQR